MDSVQEIAARFKGIDMAELKARAIEMNKEQIIALVQNQLYDKGETGEDKPLKPYSPTYQRRKISKGLYNGHPNYYWSGEWLKSVQLIVEEDKVTITNQSEITQFLIKRDGDKILLVSPESMEAAREMCMLTLRELIYQYLFE